MITVLLLVLAIQTYAVPYDLYTFSAFWLGTICPTQGCLKNETGLISPTFFNIHGLWPDYWNGYPSNCDNSSIFNSSLLTPQLSKLMDIYWVGVGQNSERFHDHEWSKHGTCWNDPAGNVSTAQKINDYFGTALAVSFKYNFYRTLAQGGIVPSTAPYGMNQFNDVLSKAWGNGTFSFSCKQYKGQQYIQELSLCLDLNYTIIPCPSYVKTNCKDVPTYYPPIEAPNRTTVYEFDFEWTLTFEDETDFIFM